MTVLHGDCRTLMAEMDAASIDSIVADPPYEIGFMGAAGDRSGIAYDVAMWGEALRVPKPGGHLVALASPRTYHRMVCAIEDAGFEIRDQLMWIFGSGFPKGGVIDGVGTCLKPAHEPIVLARKPLIGLARQNIEIYGTGGLNVDTCRLGDGSDRSTGGKTGRRLSSSEGYGGQWAMAQDGAPRATGGRWPANVLIDGSACVVTEFPAGSNGGSTARFFYCPKASKADREEGCDHLPKVKGRANIHNTVKPEGVMRWIVRLATPVGGLVLDPFAGSGSTGKAALLEGRRFIGCEREAAYVPIAQARIAAAVQRVAA